MLKIKTLQALLVSNILSICHSAQFSVDTQKNRIIDQYGRERLFHGTNVVQKTAPFIPITTHFDARLVKKTYIQRGTRRRHNFKLIYYGKLSGCHFKSLNGSICFSLLIHPQ